MHNLTPVQHPFVAKQLEPLVATMLAHAEASGADAAAVSASVENGFSVHVRVGEVELLTYENNQQIGITVYRGQSQGSASTTDLRPEAIQSTVRAAIEIAKHTQADPYSGLADRALLAFAYPNLDLFYPWMITPEAAIDLCLACENLAREQDKRIINSEGVSLTTQQSFYVYGNSHGFIGAYPRTYHYMNCTLVAGTQQHAMQRDDSYTIARDPKQLVSINNLAAEAVARTVQRLNPRSLKTCRVPVIFSADVARSLIGHFISAISGSALYRQTSFLASKLEQLVFPQWLNITEMPHLLIALGSQPFDSDGVVTSEKYFINQGRLVNYALGAYSARKLGMQTTGNADGVHNLIVTPGPDNLPSLLKKMQRGLLITELMGQGVDMVTGNYSRGAAGFWIENGELGYPVHQITVAGNLNDMFASIIAVGNDVDVRGNIRTGSILLDNLTIAGQ